MSCLVPAWVTNARVFLHEIIDKKGAPSVPGAKTTLYGTSYAWMSLAYLGEDSQELTAAFRRLVNTRQDVVSGLINAPEFEFFEPAEGALHDRDHLNLHLLCSAVLPVVQQIQMQLSPLNAVHRFCDPEWMKEWQSSIDWKHAWFEGNNILFVGQLLVYLRDVERHPGANAALKEWFKWLDKTVDPNTGLWGTDGYCSPMEAVYGGYHQLLVYYYEDHPLPNPKGLVDTVLSLQHEDGGFNPLGNAGACEDVDSVDILVNCYKRFDYRRPDIRFALKRCVKHILETQNPDGGFPYNRDCVQSHMGIPGTHAGPNVSCTFPTWFRIHTLALCAEVLPDHPELRGVPFRFNDYLSMGWHRSPPDWVHPEERWWEDAGAWAKYHCHGLVRAPRRVARRGKRVAGSALRRLGLRR